MAFLIILLVIILIIAFKTIKIVRQAEVYIIERLDYQNNLKFEEEMLIRDQVARVKKFRRRKIAYIVFGFMFFPLWLFAIIANYREKKAIEKLDKYCNLLR